MNPVIVVGTDLRETSYDAILQADLRARQTSARLLVVHALPTRLWATASDLAECGRAKQLVRERVGLLTGRQAHEYEVAALRGAPHAVLTRIASERQALLVVAASNPAHGMGHALIRPTSERVVLHGRGPVLVTRPRRGSRRIVLALGQLNHVDAQRMFAFARSEAARSSAEVVVLHCIDTRFVETLALDLIRGGAYADDPLGQRSPRAEAYRLLQSERMQSGLDAELKVLEGSPEAIILGFLQESSPDLLILGPARSGAASELTVALSQRAPCSVLVLDEMSSIEVQSPRSPDLVERAVTS